MHSGEAELAPTTSPPPQPIYRLHPELLELIFNIYVGWLIEQYRSTRLFIPWTHVCRAWRAVALSSSRLWRWIDLTHPDLATEFLARSKEAPICITASQPIYYDGESLRRHAGRIREVSAALGGEDMQALMARLGPALPSLWSLSLRAGAPGLHLSCAMPNVRLVDLRGVALEWGACTKLTRLSLQMLSAACSPSAAQLLAIITQSPALEHIKLVDIWPDLGTATIPQAPVELPRLHTLHLGVGPECVVHILSCISVPSFATIHIVNPTSSFTYIMPRDIQHLHNLTSDEESILRLDPFRLELRRSRPVDRGSQTILQVAISAMSDVVLVGLVGIIDASRIVTLEVNGWQLERIASPLFLTFLMALTRITTLKAEYAGTEFFGILTQAHSTIHATDIICPQLKSVIIEHLINTDDGQLVPLVTWLKQRNQFGVRLHKLDLYNCDFSQKKMNEARLLVDDMTIRGAEETFPANNSRLRRWAGRGGLL